MANESHVDDFSKNHEEGAESEGNVERKDIPDNLGSGGGRVLRGGRDQGVLS